MMLVQLSLRVCVFPKKPKTAVPNLLKFLRMIPFWVADGFMKNIKTSEFEQPFVGKSKKSNFPPG